MKVDKSVFFKTTEIPKSATKADKEATHLLFDKRKIIGTPVKVIRTGKEEPEDGWHIDKVYFQHAQEKTGQPVVKVRKPDKGGSGKGLEKIVPLQVLEKINPEIKFLVYETDKDYVLFQDEDLSFNIGLITDIYFEEKSVLVMLVPESDEDTAPLKRVNMSDLLDKSNDPKILEKIVEDEEKLRALKDGASP